MPPVHAPRRLTIATRSSALSVARSEQVRAQLLGSYPGTAVGLFTLPGEDERGADVSPAQAGERRFVRDLEDVVASGRADLVVHALDEVPFELRSSFALACIAAREDPRDAFVSHLCLRPRDLPDGAVVGTANSRREAQLRQRYPRLRYTRLCGELDSRLRRLDEGRCDAIVVAAAGLKRMGFGTRIASLLEPDESLPAPGQGALAIECRADRPDLIEVLAVLADRATTLATTAERAFARALGAADCTRVAAYAEWKEGSLWLRGFLAGRDGGEAMRGEVDADAHEHAAAAQLGRDLADDFLGRGAARLLAQ